MRSRRLCHFNDGYCYDIVGMQHHPCSITRAAQIACDCTQISQETVRRSANCYFFGLHDRFVASPENVTDEDIEEELSSERGHSHSSPSSLIHDKAFQLAARSFVGEHAYIKGDPNLTVCKFAEWVNTTYSNNAHPETTHRWLYELGFSRVHHQKGVYFDGHDRSDVQYRNQFLATMKELDKRTTTFNGSVPDLQEGQRLLILLYSRRCLMLGSTFIGGNLLCTYPYWRNKFNQSQHQ